jgi:hypothetical protein
VTFGSRKTERRAKRDEFHAIVVTCNVQRARSRSHLRSGGFQQLPGRIDGHRGRMTDRFEGQQDSSGYKISVLFILECILVMQNQATRS